MVAQPKAPDLNQVTEELIANSSSRRRAPLIRRTDQQWLSLFIQHNNSGLNLADFCKPRGMSPSSFSSKRKLLLSKYSINDLDSLDLNNIDFSKPTEIDSETANNNVNQLPVTDNAIVASDRVQSQSAKSEDKPESVVELVFNSFTARVPVSREPAWIADLVQKLMKVNSDMQC